MIVLVSAEHDEFFKIGVPETAELAEVPLPEMAGFVRKHGERCCVFSTEEADVVIGPADLTDAIEEAELRTELRDRSGC